MNDFQGKAAIVTGGSSGIGRACALAYAKRGAKVVVADVNQQGSEETVCMVKRAGGEAAFFDCDVSVAADVQAMVEFTVRTFGRLDCACNNAGIEGTQKPTAEYPEELWDRVIAVNLTGPWLCMKYEIEQMLRNGGGAIVNVSSILGKVAFANASAYTAAKHGLIGATKVAAVEYATQGIRVNAVCPAFIYTPMLERAGFVKGSDLYTMISNLHPVKRMGTPEEVAEAVMWLSSDAASFVTGESMLVDGGYVAV